MRQIYFLTLLIFSSSVFAGEHVISSSQLSAKTLESIVANDLAVELTKLIQEEGISYLSNPCSEDEYVPEDDKSYKKCPEGSNQWIKNKKKNYTIEGSKIYVDQKSSEITADQDSYVFYAAATQASDKNGNPKGIKISVMVGVTVKRMDNGNASVTVKIVEVLNANYNN